MKPAKIYLCTLLLLLSARSFCHAELQLAKLFSNNAVLQRDQAVQIWGWGPPKTDIKLCFNSQCYTGKSQENGAWEINIDAQPASGPYTFKVSDGKHHIEMKNVYFGDVWLASGQSNMEWPVGKNIKNMEAELSDAEYPHIRFFKVENFASAFEEKDFRIGEWKPATKETVRQFSAVAWLFAKQNHKEKKVAVGIIDSNWGGTRAEAWTSKSTLLGLKNHKKKVKATYKNTEFSHEDFDQNKLRAEDNYRRIYSLEAALKPGAHQSTYDDSRWKKANFPRAKPFKDITWLRKTFQLSHVPSSGITLNLGNIDQQAFIFLNEKLIAKEDWDTQHSVYHVPGKYLKQGENLLALRIASIRGNRPKLSQVNQMHFLAEGKKIRIQKNWLYSSQIEKPTPATHVYQNKPAFLYNAMIHPMIKYRLRGVLWYQGESHVYDAEPYGQLFKALIQDWRSQFKQALPFLFVQIAGYQYAGPKADLLASRLRQEQETALALPLTGMATAFDVGEKNDIHPRDKQSVAHRLWLVAKKLVFQESNVASSPILKSHKTKGGEVNLLFDTASGVLKVKNKEKPILGFELAGGNGVFYPAHAQLDGNQIVIKSSHVKKPASLRYAWKAYIEANLYSDNNLPVLPMKIDKL